MELISWIPELFHWFVDVVLHLDAHLVELLRDYGFWVYLILFAIVFAETGFVVTPFLPGDSLLFAAGALAAVDTSGTLSAPLLSLTLVIAAVAGNTTNYHIGRWIGPPAFSGKIPLPQGRIPATHRGVLPQARLHDHRAVAFRADPAHLRAVRGRHRRACRTRVSRPTTSLAASPGCCCWSGPATSSATSRSSRTTSAS